MKAVRPSFSDLRLICDYFRAVRNEIAIDIRSIEMVGLDPKRYGKIPRPSFWIDKLRRFAVFTRFTHRISLPAWYFLGALLFRRQCGVMRSAHSSVNKIKFDTAGQILAFSIRTLDIVHPHHIDPTPRQWLEMPWLPLSNLPNGAEVLPVAALMNKVDLNRSLVLATLAHRILQRRRGMSEWGLQSYTAWRWFFARLAVDKLPGPLLTIEHFDRWAVLADSSIRQSRNRQPLRRLIVMQHGSVNADAIPHGLNFSLPSRLRAVNHLHAYSSADVDVFKEEILSSRCANSGLAVSFYRPSITLTDMVVSGGDPSILFVGHRMCEIAHIQLLKALRKKGEWQLFYKPHPASPASAHIRMLPWTVVDGRTVFPRVDLLISYHSTLVSEYEAQSIPAVVHRMDVTIQEILELIPRILHVIHSRPAAEQHLTLQH